jgi:hypothetical protein
MASIVLILQQLRWTTRVRRNVIAGILGHDLGPEVGSDLGPDLGPADGSEDKHSVHSWTKRVLPRSGLKTYIGGAVSLDGARLTIPQLVSILREADLESNT